MKKIRSNVVEIGKNFLLKLISAFLSTGVRQFVTLPVLAAVFSKEAYGTILTINSVANITEVGLGNTLNNTRMICNAEYKKNGYKGDFNIFVIVSIVIGFVCSVILPFCFPNLNLLITLLLCLVITAGILNSYYIVGFTMNLMFDKVLIQSIIVAIGTVVGVFLTKLTGLWPFSFLIGNVFGLVYLYFNSPLMKEKLAFTPLAKKTASKWSVLIVTSILSNAMIYLDKLLLYPIIGGEAVAVYTTAAFFGKCIAALIPSASNVLLAYFSKKSYSVNRKLFLYVFGASIAICSLGFIVSLPIAPWITGLMYPKIIEEAAPFIILANAAGMLAAAGTLAQTFVLRFCKTSKLLFVQIIYSVIYVGGGLVVISSFGILGFCWLTIIANSTRLLALGVYGYRGISQTNKGENK